MFGHLLKVFKLGNCGKKKDDELSIVKKIILKILLKEKNYCGKLSKSYFDQYFLQLYVLNFNIFFHLFEDDQHVSGLLSITLDW